MEPDRDESGIVFPGSYNSVRRLGDVSYNMLRDKMGQVEVLYAPKKSARRFQRMFTVSGTNIPTFEDLRDILYLCHADTAQLLLKDNPTCFCFIAAKDEDDLSWIEKHHYRNRVFAFNASQRFYYYDSLLHGLFIDTLVWENELDRIVYSHGKLDKLINVGQEMLGNFVCIVDSGFNLIAASPDYAPQTPSLKYLLENICLPSSEMAIWENEVIPLASTHRRFITREPDDDHPVPLFYVPVFIDGEIPFYITMECANGSTDCLRDLFTKFMKRAAAICNDYWHSIVNIDSPWHRVLNSLIEGETLANEYVETQLARTFIPQASQFRLLYCRFDNHASIEFRKSVLNATANLNDGACYPFLHKDEVIVLLYANGDSEALLSSQVVNKDVGDRLLKSFGVVLSCSQVFRDIRDLRNAYRQAVIAFDLSDVFMRERLLVGETDEAPIVPFEHCLKYYLMMADADHDLIAFSFAYSILRRLVAEDEESGTEIAHLLWVYLRCDKNATETAKRVHVHRNTVLYHIDRIEKRFGLDFDSPMLRDRIVLDYEELMLKGVL